MLRSELGIPVVVTTAHRGVFFGFIKDYPETKEEVTLYNARNCLKWSEECGGFMGLASKGRGPSKNCNIGPTVSKLVLYDLTSITEIVDQDVLDRWVKKKAINGDD